MSVLSSFGLLGSSSLGSRCLRAHNCHCLKPHSKYTVGVRIIKKIISISNLVGNKATA